MFRQPALRSITYGLASVEVYPSMHALADAAAEKAASIIQSAIQVKGEARIIAATGNSQLAFIHSLTQHKEVAWERVEVFHMDEYAGMPDTHAASFRLWIKTQIEGKIPVSRVHYLQADSKDIESEILRYSDLLAAKPIDIAFVGFGENGHIAFNDPPVADFNDRVRLKLVELDEACRLQQTGEGHFPTLEDVPSHALTLTCPALFRAAAWVCSVPERRKAQAVKCALEGPVSTTCPASLVQTHPNAHVYLDQDSASLLSGPE